MKTINRRVELLEAVKKTRTHKRALPNPEEHARRGQWLGDTIDATCGPCPKRTEDGSGVIMSSELTCNCGNYPLMCKTFINDLLARADKEADEDEKRELQKFHSWLTGGRLK